jgi:hypothetical protein
MTSSTVGERIIQMAGYYQNQAAALCCSDVTPSINFVSAEMLSKF